MFVFMGKKKNFLLLCLTDVCFKNDSHGTRLESFTNTCVM